MLETPGIGRVGVGEADEQRYQPCALELAEAPCTEAAVGCGLESDVGSARDRTLGDWGTSCGREVERVPRASGGSLLAY